YVGYVLLLCWQFSPLIFLSFFNFHRPMDGEGYSLIPLRYYLVTYPAQFLIAGMGFAFLWNRFAKARAGLVAATALALAVCVFFSVAYLLLLGRTGKALDYLNARAPTLRTMIEIRDVLLEEAGINADEYYERTATFNILSAVAGEAT